MSEEKKKNIIHRILVPVTGTDTDEEIIRTACWIANRDKSKVYVLYIITIKRSLPLEAEIESETRKAEEILISMEKIAEDEDYIIETDLLQAREIAPTIIEQAVDRKIDLILMGIKPQTRFGQFNLGSTVPYVLRNAPCKVMLYSQSIKESSDRENI